jgi:hypothetical protein
MRWRQMHAIVRCPSLMVAGDMIWCCHSSESIISPIRHTRGQSLYAMSPSGPSPVIVPTARLSSTWPIGGTWRSHLLRSKGPGFSRRFDYRCRPWSERWSFKPLSSCRQGRILLHDRPSSTRRTLEAFGKKVKCGLPGFSHTKFCRKRASPQPAGGGLGRGMFRDATHEAVCLQRPGGPRRRWLETQSQFSGPAALMTGVQRAISLFTSAASAC